MRNVLFILALVACWVIPYAIYHANHSESAALSPPRVELGMPSYERHTPDLDRMHPPVRDAPLTPPTVVIPKTPSYESHTRDLDNHWLPPIRDAPAG